MSLRQQLEDMEIGETLVTFQNRNGIYVAAKRAKVNITTAVQSDTSILITKTKYETKPEPDIVLPPQSGVEYTILALKNMKTADRMSVFEEFELCCGMNRGECVCPDEEVVVNATIISANAEKLARAKAIMAQFEENEGKLPVNPVVSEEMWVFSKDKPWYADDGNVYRRQLLAPEGKQTRTVQVDEDNTDKILATR